ncbi:hypothetical protein ACET3Z_026942 [Daucus carota]
MAAKKSSVPKEEEDLETKGDQQEEEAAQHHSIFISDMKPLTKEAYGGGMYGHDDDDDKTGQPENTGKTPASDTQSADGPVGPTVEPKHKPPPSTGDRDVDITGQSYIQ